METCKSQIWLTNLHKNSNYSPSIMKQFENNNTNKNKFRNQINLFELWALTSCHFVFDAYSIYIQHLLELQSGIYVFTDWQTNRFLSVLESPRDHLVPVCELTLICNFASENFVLFGLTCLRWGEKVLLEVFKCSGFEESYKEQT